MHAEGGDEPRGHEMDEVMQEGGVRDAVDGGINQPNGQIRPQSSPCRSSILTGLCVKCIIHKQN
jgi:hypothetical protein